ncbi:type V toxin-antitoxin system endoribonuclease antitoxin GhoS [Pantoea sp. A4]|uniref:type V toxin-antitoxin system endoribonuclease antitoxin GhoS n=1 Tax=Pantoea sp. A4 TaxID=1225184 RepID=UPI0003652D5F|nr:type V toxin-antitoxin system endoribonuclease antitoxin GhoS [Pantoea sp. A4]
MATFTVRVELHNADYDDYELLHKKMNAKGYKRTVTASSGTEHHLPDAEYTFESSSKDESAVADEVKAIADSVKNGSGVLVTKSAGRAIRGLKVV